MKCKRLTTIAVSLVCALSLSTHALRAQRVVRETRAQWERIATLTLTATQAWCASVDSPGCEFKGPASVRATPDGGVLASDAQGPLHRFGADGTFIGALGRRGKGPGEYGFIVDASVTSNGFVSWFDMTAMRIASVSLDNKPGPSTAVMPPYTMAGMYMLDTQLVVLDVPASPTIGTVVDATYRTVTANGAPRVLARVRTPAVLVPGSDLRPMAGPFDPRVVSDVGPSGDVAHSNGEEYDVAVFPHNAAAWRLLVAAPERSVTSAERDSAQAAILKRFRVTSLAALPAPVRDAYSASRRTHPPVSLIKVLKDGTLWIRTSAGPYSYARWDVFTNSGDPIGQAHLPFGARVWDGARDWVLVSEPGEDDVPRLVRYRVSATARAR